MKAFQIAIFRLPAGAANFHYVLRVYLDNGSVVDSLIERHNYIALRSFGANEIDAPLDGKGKVYNGVQTQDT